MALAEFTPVKSPVFGMELVPFSFSHRALRSKLIAEKNQFETGFRCPNCGKLFPIFSGLQLHYQNCEVKPVEPTKSPPKTSRKRKTRTSLNAAGISTWQAGQANPESTPEVKSQPEVEEAKPEMSVKEKLLSALGLIQKSDKTPDDKPAKKLPIFIPEKCPTFGGDLGMFKFDLIETVECSGRADYFQPPTDVKLEIREPEDLESPTPTPKPKPGINERIGPI